MANSKKAENEVKRTGLYWPGKRTEMERVALPFQVVETVNVSRATREELPLLAGAGSQEAEGWCNKLIRGENNYIMASLLDQGFAGKINLIYIDPPFAKGNPDHGLPRYDPFASGCPTAKWNACAASNEQGLAPNSPGYQPGSSRPYAGRPGHTTYQRLP